MIDEDYAPALDEATTNYVKATIASLSEAPLERFKQRLADGREVTIEVKTVRFIPLHDRILVRRIEAETERGGILIPSNAIEKPQLADVLAIGAGRLLESGQRVALDVHVGDRVMFGKFSGAEVQLNGELLLILREDEVLGRIPSE